jgi:hypothetical protein
MALEGHRWMYKWRGEWTNCRGLSTTAAKAPPPVEMTLLGQAG